jgi:hypothetical protein
VDPILKGQEVQEDLKMGMIRYPETSEKDYHSTLLNILEERRSPNISLAPKRNFGSILLSKREVK